MSRAETKGLEIIDVAVFFSFCFLVAARGEAARTDELVEWRGAHRHQASVRRATAQMFRHRDDATALSALQRRKRLFG
jgi:hypothetical protein